MNVPDEHDDDLEPEVIEGADIETVTYPGDDEFGESEPRRDRTHSSGRVNEPDGRTVRDEPATIRATRYRFVPPALTRLRDLPRE